MKVVHREQPGAKITKVTILANQTKFSELQDALERLGITGITVTNVFGYGAQKGHTVFFRGNPVSSRLLPKIKIDIVICKIPVETLIRTVQDTLYNRQLRRRQDLHLRRGGRREDPHRRKRLRRAAG